MTMQHTDYARTPARGPVSRLLRLFSSIWLGVCLLLLLFVYSSIGSAGLPIGPGATEWPFILRPDAWVSVRELPGIELSEFDWFHWWPFDVLIALICLNLTVATIRRIPFNVVNLGVWMIHTGIIVLALGSVWYFGTKVEGDTPVARRQVVARVAGHPEVRFVATPGNRVRVGAGEDAYVLQVSGITPEWELLSGDDEGKKAYKVSVMVQSPTRLFVRELLAGYPQYTEDLVRSDDPQQPFARAKKTLGTALVDETLALELAYDPQEHFYLMGSAAIYLREAGATEWIERPVRDMPRFNDHVASYEEVWTAPGDPLPPLRPLDVRVPAVDPDDPLPGVEFRVSAYLRYAAMQTRRVPGGDRLDPTATLVLRDDRGRGQEFEVRAFDPEASVLGGGVIEFRWLDDEAEMESLRATRPSLLRVALADGSVVEEKPITAVAGTDESYPFTPLGESAYAYRVKSVQDDLAIEGRTFSVAILDIRKGDETFTRWVFDDPKLQRDLPSATDPGAHAGGRALDDNLVTTYTPGRRTGLRLVAGPDERRLRLLVPDDSGTMSERAVTLNEPMSVRNGISLTVTSYAARSRSETRPLVVPKHQRDRDVGVQASMVRLHVPTGGNVASRWLGYHVYPFRRVEEVLRRFPYAPTVVHLADGRHVEVMFSRERMLLPDPVVLEDFELAAHIGGFSGSSASVRNWTSRVRFGEPDGTWSQDVAVSVNDPQERDGFWFFQSQWDPPTAPTGPGDPGSQGLNYTVLGVGNREGVHVQLVGCCLSVVGMIYAFYVKPTIRRRRQNRVYAEAAARRAEDVIDVNEAPAMVGAAEESR